MDPLDQKLNRVFPGCVVRKDLLHQIKKGTNVPSFVLEFLLAKFCATDDPDEIQAGTYATMDRQYYRLVPEFEVALSVLVRVISRPTSRQAVLDLGVKGAGGEFGVPEIRDFPDVEIPYFLSEEHLVVRNTPDWRIGHVLQLIPSHACTTCNLYRELIVHQQQCVVDVWPIEAAGRLT